MASNTRSKVARSIYLPASLGGQSEEERKADNPPEKDTEKAPEKQPEPQPEKKEEPKLATPEKLQVETPKSREESSKKFRILFIACQVFGFASFVLFLIWIVSGTKMDGFSKDPKQVFNLHIFFMVLGMGILQGECKF